jgi:maleylacetoacetate isomerase
MKLFDGITSSASWRVRWGLALKKVDYERVPIDVAAGEQHGVPNPMHQVPTLVLDDGRILTESVAILEWLEETIPTPPLLPGDALDRARVRELVQLVNAGIHPLQNSSVRSSVPDGAAWARRWIARGLEAYEAHLQRTPSRFSFGDTITMADLFLVPQVRNAARFALDIGHLTRVREVYERCMETPEARATAPAARPPNE